MTEEDLHKLMVADAAQVKARTARVWGSSQGRPPNVMAQYQNAEKTVFEALPTHWVRLNFAYNVTNLPRGTAEDAVKRLRKKGLIEYKTTGTKSWIRKKE